MWLHGQTWQCHCPFAGSRGGHIGCLAVRDKHGGVDFGGAAASQRSGWAKPPTLGPLNLELRWAASGPAAWTLTVLANGPLPGMRRPGCFAQCLAALAPRPSLLEAGALMRACGTIWMTMPLALFKAPSLLHTWLPTT